MDILQECRRVFDVEIEQLQAVRQALDHNMVTAVRQIYDCTGKIAVCGIGKPGHVARKIAATLSSLGIAAFHLHPVEALHGDLGSLNKNDIVLLISNSGNSKEIIDLFPTLKLIGIKSIAITANKESELASYSDLVILLPKIKEACRLNLAPTSSTTVEMVIGDALAVAVSALKNFNNENFALYHPAGSLGKKLLIRVREIMRKDEKIPIAHSDMLVKDALVLISQKQMGALCVVDVQNRLSGIMTNGDIRTAFERGVDIYSTQIDSFITKKPVCVLQDELAVDALQVMIKTGVTILPVIDQTKKVVGIITSIDILSNGIVL